MINFLAGLALGAVFAPFWIMIWNKVTSAAGKELQKRDLD